MLTMPVVSTPKESKGNSLLNRSNSFVSALKWWPLHSNSASSQQQQQQASSSAPTTPISSSGDSTGSIAFLHHGHHLNNNNGGGKLPFPTFGSSVAVQKLRESKWFKRDEARIFCAVVECGFIVELRSSAAVIAAANAAAARSRSHSRQNSSEGAYQDDSDYDDDDYEDDDNDDVRDNNVTRRNDVAATLAAAASAAAAANATWFGIVLCKSTKEHKTKPETIEIYSVRIRDSGLFKMVKCTLEEVWQHGWELRINNFADKEKVPHNEKDIRQQVSFARKAKQSLWNNNKHFVYWCRYGSRQQDVRKRQMSECVRWGGVGMNAGMLLVMNKQKSVSASK